MARSEIARKEIAGSETLRDETFGTRASGLLLLQMTRPVPGLRMNGRPIRRLHLPGRCRRQSVKRPDQRGIARI